MTGLFIQLMSKQILNNSNFIIIPAFNETTVIKTVVEELILAGYSIVIVDDGSEENLLAQVLVFTNTYYIRHAVNLGQGAALQTGIEFALQKKATYLVTLMRMASIQQQKYQSCCYQYKTMKQISHWPLAS